MPSGISRLAVTRSASTEGMKSTFMIPAGIIATQRIIMATPDAITIPGWPVAKRRLRSSGPAMKRCSPDSTPDWMRLNRRGPPAAERAPRSGRCERWLGRTSRDSISEKTRTDITMIGISPTILPIELGMKKRGQNATIVVRTAKITGRVIRRVPRIEARTPFEPLSRSA